MFFAMLTASIAIFAAGCAATTSVAHQAASFTQAIPGTAQSIELVAVHPPATSGLAPFCVSRCEVTWDVYDIFTYRLDEAGGEVPPGVDAVTRPSKPYIAMDRGFGNKGYPAISMSCHGAQTFCQWLSAKTGRVFRLPTEQEWRWLCEQSDIDALNLSEHAWHAGNADHTTHPAGSKAADSNGLHDLLGNASEWCIAADGGCVTLGGNYQTQAGDMTCDWRAEPSPAWNASDPQFPKSVWWLADGGFVGFRVVCEVDADKERE